MSDKIRVLYAEDEIDIRESLAMILESEGFEVSQAENGAKALELFLEKEFDVVISDVKMPDFTGHDLLKAIRERKDSDNSHIPFILLTAFGARDDIMKGYELEASDYITKPVDFDLLIAKVKEKAHNYRKGVAVTDKKIDNLKSQVSSSLPNEILHYVDLINQISNALRSQIYGPLPHQKYIDDINKIYINSLKLKTMVSNFLSGEAMSNQLDVNDEILNPLTIIQEFVGSLNKKFSSQIDLSEIDENTLLDVKINKKILFETIKKFIGCMLKINNEMVVKISISYDPSGSLLLIFISNLKIENGVLEDHINKSVVASELERQGLSMELLSRDDSSVIVLSIPNYRVIQKN